MPPYGGSIAQNLYYADSDLCDPNVDTSKGYPSRDEENGKMKPWPSPYILMLDRGGCTFVKKVRNKQAGIVSSGIVHVLQSFSFRSEMRNVPEQLESLLPTIRASAATVNASPTTTWPHAKPRNPSWPTTDPVRIFRFLPS